MNPEADKGPIKYRSATLRDAIKFTDSKERERLKTIFREKLGLTLRFSMFVKDKEESDSARCAVTQRIKFFEGVEVSAETLAELEELGIQLHDE